MNKIIEVAMKKRKETKIAINVLQKDLRKVS